MYYASIGLLSLVLHLIINHEVLVNKTKNKENIAVVRYRQFLFGLIIYYLADSLWGFFSDLTIPALTYADTVIYFVSMTLSVLLWVLYVVAYIDRKGKKSTSLTYAVYIIFALSIIAVIVNIFKPIIFYITPENDYVPLVGRYIVFGIQFLLDVVLSVYSLIVTFMSKDRDRIHYRMVSASCAVMAVLIFLQTMFPNMPFYAIGCILATCIVHVFVEEDEKEVQDKEFREVKNVAYIATEISEKVKKEKDIFTSIAESLAEDYEAIYYIDIETGKYREFAPSEKYESLEVSMDHGDFYKDTAVNIERFVHPEDRKYAKSIYTKENMLKVLEERKSYAYKYRLIINEEPRYFRFVLMLAKDGKHFVVCDKDITEAIKTENELRRQQKKSITFSQIAESLASNYDVIYYVNIKNNNYLGYNTRNIYGQLEIERMGDDFFKESEKNSMLLIHPQDREKFTSFVNKDYMLTALEDRRQISLDYRMVINDDIKYTRLFIRKSSDMNHFILGVESIDDEVRKEREHLNALNTQKELARRDDLTGTKNKTAYSELEKSVQSNIDNGLDYLLFGIAICDVNDLKKINDTKGHKAGDDYIKASAKLLCDIFDHSPVFRIGGDEFVVFLRGDDYTNRLELEKRFKDEIKKNLFTDDKPVVAIGMSEYIPNKDTSVSQVFERADNLMYEDKRKLKSIEEN